MNRSSGDTSSAIWARRSVRRHASGPDATTSSGSSERCSSAASGTDSSSSTIHGFHQELIRERITPADVGWAVALAERLSARQWEEAFRAGGYQPDVAARFLDVLHGRIAKARQIAAAGPQEARGQ